MRLLAMIFSFGFRTQLTVKYAVLPCFISYSVYDDDDNIENDDDGDGLVHQVLVTQYNIVGVTNHINGNVCWNSFFGFNRKWK